MGSVVVDKKKNRVVQMSTITAKQFAMAFAMCEQPQQASSSTARATASPAAAAAAAPAPPAAAPSGPAAKPEFKKYAMMQKMHLPRGAIEQKMRAEGKSDGDIKEFFGD